MDDKIRKIEALLADEQDLIQFEIEEARNEFTDADDEKQEAKYLAKVGAFEFASQGLKELESSIMAVLRENKI